jgi:hypothetical protein
VVIGALLLAGCGGSHPVAAPLPPTPSVSPLPGAVSPGAPSPSVRVPGCRTFRVTFQPFVDDVRRASNHLTGQIDRRLALRHLGRVLSGVRRAESQATGPALRARMNSALTQANRLRSTSGLEALTRQLFLVNAAYVRVRVACAAAS